MRFGGATVRPMDTIAQIQKTDSEKQIAYGVVYEPGVPDAHGDYMTAEDIEEMAHKFLAEGRVTSIDTEHDMTDNGSCVVESFVARKGDPDFAEGAWVMGVHIPDPAVWAEVKCGEIGGFSMFGKAYREEAEIELQVPDDGMVWGTTFDHDGHQHRYVVKFDDDGKFLGGMTDEVNGHSHMITKGTVTDQDSDADHRHRFDYLEQMK